MSKRDYDEAVKLIEEHSSMAEFVGPRPLHLIEQAERELGLRFPATYKQFLLQYGAGNFGSSEIYGVIDADWEDSSVPDVVWYAKELRREGDWPNDLLPIAETGNGELICLDLERTEGSPEPRVVAVTPGADLDDREFIAEDFGDYLRVEVENLV